MTSHDIFLLFRITVVVVMSIVLAKARKNDYSRQDWRDRGLILIDGDARCSERQLMLWCACGWTKVMVNAKLAWLRLLMHELRRHRKDGLWQQCGINRFRTIFRIREGGGF